MLDCVRHPVPGCVVEYLEGNAVQIAVVTEEVAGNLRLLLPNRRETRLKSSRVLPWMGPLLTVGEGKEENIRALDLHKKKREDLLASISLEEGWELIQGEEQRVSALWFAELLEQSPSADLVAACGRALLACKTHFRFQPPDFQVFSADIVEKREQEQKARIEREKLLTSGNALLRLLWDVACQRAALPGPEDGHGTQASQESIEKIEKILWARMLDPENSCNEADWRLLSKGLPDVPHLALQLLTAWGKTPPHYNFWLHRADYAPGDTWWEAFRPEVEHLAASAENTGLEASSLPFVSIDSASTKDVDDAFHVQRDGADYLVTLALALPAWGWPFGSPLDRLVLRRATSIYLPEGDCHMLPEILGTGAFSLLAGEKRPALCIELRVDARGACKACRPFLALVSLAANLNYGDCQAVLDAGEQGAQSGNAAAAHASQLALALELARKRQAVRIASGAVIMDRPEPEIVLEGHGPDLHVDIRKGLQPSDAQMLVAEMMILASAAVAQWAGEHSLPMLHRVQDVALPREYAGIWSSPQDMTRIMRALIPSSLEIQPRPHAALGLAAYTPVTSPLRRYSDLVNEAQIMHYLRNGSPLWNTDSLADLLGSLSLALDAVGRVQRFRPRYWKLLYFQQQGDKIWWPGIVTEENDAFVSVCLPDQAIFVRGRRRLFDDKVYPGMAVQVRIGKVHPLYNAISIVESAAVE